MAVVKFVEVEIYPGFVKIIVPVGEMEIGESPVYPMFVRAIFDAGIDIHYMVNITGHGWRKLMRAEQKFTYTIHTIPEPQPIFRFIQHHSNTDDNEMYGNFNMGAGFAIFVSKKDGDDVLRIAKKHHFKSWSAGVVEKGAKQVVLESKKIIFSEKTLAVR